MIIEQIQNESISKSFQNSLYQNMPLDRLISKIFYKLILKVPIEEIFADIKINSSESNYDAAQKIIKINELIGFRKVGKLKTLKGLDKLLEEARRKTISIHNQYYK